RHDHVQGVHLRNAANLSKEWEPLLSPLALEQNYPNPFNPQTVVAFTLDHPSNVVLGVYDMVGRLVRTLGSGQMGAQRHEFIWDGRDGSDNDVASGVYCYRLEIDGVVHSKEMVLLR
ncbi:MAG: T9SS type A sorting domain-containing protein, partial [Candidatus Eisenbacteria sp.]|nr:T9SS type A sorting domain-containing protein [Candidatus Eisenbacteria bacterium]